MHYDDDDVSSCISPPHIAEFVPDRLMAARLHHGISSGTLVGAAAPVTTAASPPHSHHYLHHRRNSSSHGTASLSSVRALSPTASAFDFSPAWLPTRLTSPYRVLSAAGMQDDYYTSCLSYGREYVALALRDDLLLFHPSKPGERSATAHVSGAVSSSGATSSVKKRNTGGYPTAIAITRFDDNACFLGLSSGAAELYVCRSEGAFAPTMSFAMPEPPTDRISALLTAHWDKTSPAHHYPRQQQHAALSDALGRGAAVSVSSQKVRGALAALVPSVASVGCISTSNAHPTMAAVGTSACGLLALDSRHETPVVRFGSDLPPLWQQQQASSPSAEMASLATFLADSERLCSVSWNANGSLLATGSGSGLVSVWALSSPRHPIMVLDMGRSGGICGSGGGGAAAATVKALMFHLTNPYELSLGAGRSSEGEGSSFCIYDVSGASPVLSWSAPISARMTQVLYSPDGTHLVTSHDNDRPHSMRHTDVQQGVAPASPPSPHAQGLRRRGMTGTRAGVFTASPPPAPWEDNPLRWSGEGPFATMMVGGMNGNPLEESAGDPLYDCVAVAPYSLVVWKKGLKQRGEYLRDAVLGGAEESTQMCITTATSSNNSNSSTASVHHQGGSGVRGTTEYDQPRPLLRQYALLGHRARPLHLSSPFQHSSNGGCVVSAAAGVDGTIRFWRVFQPFSAASDWEQRTSALLQTATTEEDLEECTAPRLR